MTYNIRNSIVSVALFAALALLGSSVASASQVTGTLTSGSTGTTVTGSGTSGQSCPVP
jgi:hypothetical protein